jgi:4,5-DOPA dioxygenase extradiol
MNKRQPALFIGHGSPMNAIADNAYAKNLRKWGDHLRESKPRAAIMFSAHWETDALQVLTSPEPRTIHDFYGFPRPLFEVQYLAKGEPALAERVLTMLEHEAVVGTTQWGFDHGVWSVMRHLWPDADLPILMISLARRLDPETHFRVGQHLKPLRDEGVIIIGSGNIVHNLKEVNWQETAPAYPWAAEFDAKIKKAIEERDEKTLISASRASDLASRKSIPSREHYLPIVPIIGATDASEKPLFITEEIQNGSIAMRSVVFGYEA